MQCTTYIYILLDFLNFAKDFAQNIQNDPSVGFFSGSILGSVYEHLLWRLQGHFKLSTTLQRKECIAIKKLHP